MFRMSFVFVITLLCLTCQANEAKIKFGFNRYFVKGQVYYIKVKYEQTQSEKSEVSGSVINENNQSGVIDYVSRILVNSVSPRGLATEEIHEIVRANQTVNGENRDILDKGDSLMVSNEDTVKKIKMYGKDVDVLLYKNISGFLEMNLGGPNYDDMFHDGKAHAGGEAWGINSEIILGSFKDQKVELKPEQLSGSSKMIKEGDSYHLVGEFNIKSFPFLKNSTEDSDYHYKVESYLYDSKSLLPYKNIKTTVQKIIVGDDKNKKTITITKKVTTEYFISLSELNTK